MRTQSFVAGSIQKNARFARTEAGTLETSVASTTGTEKPLRSAGRIESDTRVPFADACTRTVAEPSTAPAGTVSLTGPATIVVGALGTTGFVTSIGRSSANVESSLPSGSFSPRIVSGTRLESPSSGG